MSTIKQNKINQTLPPNIDAYTLQLLEKSGALTQLKLNPLGEVIGTLKPFCDFFNFPYSQKESNLLKEWLPCHEQKEFALFLQKILDSNSPLIHLFTLKSPRKENCYTIPCNILGSVSPIPNFKKNKITSVQLFLIPKQQNPFIPQKIIGNHHLQNLGLLSAGIAHDLNNIFSNVLCCTSQLQTKPNYSKLKKNIAFIEKTIDQASNMTDNILHSIQNNHQPIKAIDPIPYILSITPIFKKSLSKKIKFTLNLPKKHSDVFIQANHLIQIYLNLIINARDAIEDQGNIEATIRYEPKFFILEVFDDGQGLQPEQKTLIFDPLYTTKAEQNGTGLGLAIIKNIIDEMQGKIEIESNPNTLTCFRIKIPF